MTQQYVRLPDSADPQRIRPVYGVVTVVTSEGSPAEAQLIVPNDNGRLALRSPWECVAVTAAVVPCERCGVPQEVRDLHTTDDGLLLCAGCEAPPVEVPNASPSGSHYFAWGGADWQCRTCGMALPLGTGRAYSDAWLDAHSADVFSSVHQSRFPQCLRCAAYRERQARRVLQQEEEQQCR